MRVCGCLCFGLLSLISDQQQAVRGLNVDQAKEALNGRDNGGYTELHIPSNGGVDDTHEDEAEDIQASFIDRANHEEDPETSVMAENDEELSFLEDLEDSDFDEEDYDLDAMDEEDAKVIAGSMRGDERRAFLQRWEAHKANRKANGNPDTLGTFAEF